jgi:hypothetical protein
MIGGFELPRGGVERYRANFSKSVRFYKTARKYQQRSQAGPGG